MFVLNRWSELTTWQHGVLVKHVKGLFKADGINNAAEPGNSMHSRFYVSKPGRQVPIFSYFSQHTPIFPIF